MSTADMAGFRLGIYVFKDAEIIDYAAPYTEELLIRGSFRVIPCDHDSFCEMQIRSVSASCVIQST
jgi:hypothetical protein